MHLCLYPRTLQFYFWGAERKISAVCCEELIRALEHEEEHNSHLPFIHIHRVSDYYAENMKNAFVCRKKPRVSLFLCLLMLSKQRDPPSLQYILFFYLLTSFSI